MPVLTTSPATPNNEDFNYTLFDKSEYENFIVDSETLTINGVSAKNPEGELFFTKSATHLHVFQVEGKMALNGASLKGTSFREFPEWKYDEEGYVTELILTIKNEFNHYLIIKATW